MDKYYSRQQEEHNYMFVKKLGSIPYYGDCNEAQAKLPEDGKVYFEVISNHFLKGVILRMDSRDFDEVFTSERASHDPNMDTRYKGQVFSSREWLFYDKVLWWNNNIKAVIDSSARDSVEYLNLYNGYCDEYCIKFKVDVGTFIRDKNFFDDFLSEVYVDKNGKVHSSKERMSKPKLRKYCSACGSKARYYTTLPNGKILCRVCEEQIDMYENLRFEKQWEE